MKILYSSIMDKKKTACFSGHRLPSLPDGSRLCELESSVYEQIEQAYANGYRAFIHGFCHGFDILAAKQVIKFKKNTGHDIILIGIQPFWGLPKGKSPSARKDFDYVHQNTQVTDILSMRYDKQYYFLRNDLMTENSSLLICYCENRRSGTGYTLSSAEKKGLKIVNLYDERLCG